MIKLGMPEISPLYPELPYNYEEYRRVGLFCIANDEAVRELVPEPLEPISNIIEVFVMRATKVTGLNPYDEGGVVVQCKYKGTKGAHVAYEYVSSDESLSAGREIWGYPKKIADVKLDEYGEKVDGWVMRKGKKIISVNFGIEEKTEFEIPNMQPRFQIKKIPRVDQPGFDVANVIRNEFSGKTKYILRGNGKVLFEKADEDPLHLLGPKEIIGGTFTVGQFLLGYGKVVGTLD